MQIEGGRFLVIGGAGFIGSHLVEQLLEQGAAHVLIYDNFSRGTRENLAHVTGDKRLSIYEDGGDIIHRDTLLRAMDGIDGVFHLAALWLLQCNEYPRSAFEVNVTGTMNVIEAVIASGAKRLVFSSSASVYGDALQIPMEEDHPFNCKEFYGASKVCGEVLLRALYNREKAKGGSFEYVGLRYMNVYGCRQNKKGDYVGVIVRMLNALDVDQQPVIHGDGSQSYDFIDVRDCARANILAMQAEVTDSFYNVGTGTRTSIKELAALITARHGSGAGVKFEKSARPMVQTRVASTHLAHKDLGFVSSINLEQGLSELIKCRKKETEDKNDY